jgi:hypothetical protein
MYIESHKDTDGLYFKSLFISFLFRAYFPLDIIMMKFQNWSYRISGFHSSEDVCCGC